MRFLTHCLLPFALALTGCETDNASDFADCGCSAGQICVDLNTAPSCMPVPAECGSPEPTACEDAQGSDACVEAICGEGWDSGPDPASVCHDEEGTVYRFFTCS